MPDTTPEVFDLGALWLLQSCIRADVPNLETWRWAPCSIELNDQIADAILLCEDKGQTEAVIELTRHDCIAIDSLVRADMKDASGRLVGKELLLKSYRARQRLAYGGAAETIEPAQPEWFPAWKAGQREVGQ